MSFGDLLAGLASGGASVDTVLDDAEARPGGVLRGEVRLVGGDGSIDLQQVEVALVARTTTDGAQGELARGVSFASEQVARRMRLRAGARHTIPFSLTLPWETPLTVHGEQALPGTSVGVRTDVPIARAVGKDDLAPLRVHPTPAQEQVLAALARAGFRVEGASCEAGPVPGSSLTFHQRVRLSREDAARAASLAVAFLPGPDATEVLVATIRRDDPDAEGDAWDARVRVGPAASADEVGRLLDVHVTRLAS